MQRLILLAFATLCFQLISVQPGIAERPNVLILCVDDLRPELHCFGVDYIHSPNINALAASGVSFTRHYVQSPSCGPSRYALLTGRYETDLLGHNDSLLKRAAKIRKGQPVPVALPEHFRQSGYTTVSIGKVSHHPGGLAGKNWNDPNAVEMPRSWDRHLMPCGPWETPERAMHGLKQGAYRVSGGAYNDRDKDAVSLFESFPGPADCYPDGLIVEEGLKQLNQLWGNRKQQPFLLAVGVIRPHLPFGAPAKHMEHYRNIELPPVPHPQKPSGKTTWHRSGEFFKYQRGGGDPRTDPEFNDLIRKHYAACVSYADENVGRILQRLAELDPDRETIVVLWGDHGFHLGEHAIWGKHDLFEEALRSPLIIRAPQITDSLGQQTTAITESVDVFPTLCELAGLDVPAGLCGKSLVPNLQDPELPGRPAIAYRAKAKTIRTDRYRLIVHPGGETELYDHLQPDAETLNLSTDQPGLVNQLTEQLNRRLAEQGE